MQKKCLSKISSVFQPENSLIGRKLHSDHSKPRLDLIYEQSCVTFKCCEITTLCCESRQNFFRFIHSIFIFLGVVILLLIATIGLASRVLRGPANFQNNCSKSNRRSCCKRNKISHYSRSVNPNNSLENNISRTGLSMGLSNNVDDSSELDDDEEWVLYGKRIDRSSAAKVGNDFDLKASKKLLKTEAARTSDA